MLRSNKITINNISMLFCFENESESKLADVAIVLNCDNRDIV